jgi:TatD DNase family protein
MSNKQDQSIYPWVDSHCHLDFDVFNTQRESILLQGRNKGMMNLLVPATQSKRWNQLIALANEHNDIVIALGLHPYFLCDEKINTIDTLPSLIKKNTHVVAIGETGLDAMIDDVSFDVQRDFFVKHLQLAQELQKPLILHVRKCHDEVIGLLKRYSLNGGVIHAFSGSLQQAENYVKLGFKLGFGGAITYDRAKKLQTTFKALPIESILLETDAPDMRPTFARETISSPLYIPRYITIMAALRGMSEEAFSEVCLNNFKNTFLL